MLKDYEIAKQNKMENIESIAKKNEFIKRRNRDVWKLQS